MDKKWMIGIFCTLSAIFFMQLASFFWIAEWDLWKPTLAAAAVIFLIGFVVYVPHSS